MMNVRQLLADMDTIRKGQKHDLAIGEANFVSYLPVYNKQETGKDFRKRLDSLKALPAPAEGSSFASRIPDSLRGRVMDAAIANMRNAMTLVGYTAMNVRLQNDNLVKREIALHGKFTLSFACVLLFLIGAPLGAIIRKGGLGLPIVVAIGFFVVYFIMSKTGEQLSQSGLLPAYIGMWLSTIMLLPIAFFMIRQARNDSPVFSKEWYLRRWAAIAGRLRNRRGAGKPEAG
jgi:lipopolysaccharide export system permease protein